MATDFTIARDEAGVPHVEAAGLEGLVRGLGHCHATDRALPMLLLRILGRGRAAELLDPSDEGVRLDRFFRRMNWAGGTAEAAASLSPRARALAQAYCDGASAALAKGGPWELRLAGAGRPEPWTIEDSILIAKMTGYLTLAQSQAEIERLLVEMVQAGVDRARLEELFPGLLGGLDEALLRRVKLGERIVPESIRWGAALPRLVASNNWVVAGRMTASGKPLLASDPHLEGNRLPNVWYEVVLRAGDRYAMGATIPGLPAVAIGRTNDVAWAATYSFMDAIDSWIEDCRDGRYRRGDEWVPFRVRRETIRRRGAAPVEVDCFENDHGVLEGDPRVEGLYLATRWASAEGGARTLEALEALWEARTAADALAALARAETAWNWVAADRAGGIGYRMSGRMPLRREGVSGLVPLPGWDPANDWRGFADADDLPRAHDPAEGFFVTANQDLNAFGSQKPINMPMGPYRADRIAERIRGRTGLTVEDMAEIQYDVVSPQAEALMKVLRPLLPATPQGEILRAWDGRYDPGSRGAFLFEEVYAALLGHVFGDGGLGFAVVEHLRRETGAFVDFYLSFDRILLAERSAWFTRDGRPVARDDLYREVAARALAVEPRPWGETRRIALSHILFGGRLPRFLGFDRGPVTVRGGRATPHQGQIYRSGGRATSFVPAFRMVTDMARDEVRTNLLGGPSDRRFSRFYASEVEAWLTGRYKTLAPEIRDSGWKTAPVRV